MADASSAWSASTSLDLRSNVWAQRCRSARASISWAVIRTRSPDRVTDPSTMASTLSVFAISGVGGRFCPLNCIADPRDVTRSWLIDREVAGQLIRHPLGEILLGGIGGIVVERQHGDRADRTAGACPGRGPHAARRAMPRRRGSEQPGGQRRSPFHRPADAARRRSRCDGRSRSASASANSRARREAVDSAPSRAHASRRHRPPPDVSRSTRSDVGRSVISFAIIACTDAPVTGGSPASIS